jgi:DNA-binding transcriptional LysR family regulator
LTLEQLRIFVAVAEREHVTLGARDLNLTQSATSAAIAALEARHATKLFDRVGRRIALTEAGRVFLEEARAVLARAGAAEAVLADLSGLKRGALSIAASQTVGGYWLPERLGRFREQYPGIAVTVTIGNTQQAAAQVRDGAADLGIVEGEVDMPVLAATAVAEDEMVLVVRPAHPWAKGAGKQGMGLTGSPWVVRERGSGTRAIFDGLAGTAVPADDLLVLPSNEAVRGAVIAGAGAAVLSRLVVADALALGLLVTVEADLPRRSFLALAHRERHRTRAAAEFCRMIGADI